MNQVEVDACGLEKPLLISIVRRALAISGGKPVVVTVENEEAVEHVRKLADDKKRRLSVEKLPDGRICLQLTS